MLNNGKLYVISGPSGVGKSSIVNAILSCREDMILSISATTRKPRGEEKDGVDYFFITEEDFLKMIKEDKLIEYSQHFDTYYGTPKDFVNNNLQKGINVILDIDVNGGYNIKKLYEDAVLIMVAPPSIEILENRLRGRQTETEENIQKRLARAKYELSKNGDYDYYVVNDDLTETIAKIKEIIK